MVEKGTADLREAIKAAAAEKNLALAAGAKFAERIRPGVRKCLEYEDEGGGYPSASKIKTAIRKVKSGTKL